MSYSTGNKRGTPSSFGLRVLTAAILLFTGWLSARVSQPDLSVDPPGYQVSRSGKWPKVQADHLKAHPVCENCGTRDNLEVHHVLPFHTHPELELDPSNLITLCRKPGHNCHFTIGHWWNYEKSNPNVRQDIKRLKASRAEALEH